MALLNSKEIFNYNNVFISFTPLQEVINNLNNKLKNYLWFKGIYVKVNANRKTELVVKCRDEPKFEELIHIFSGYYVSYIWPHKYEHCINNIIEYLTEKFARYDWFVKIKKVNQYTLAINVKYWSKLIPPYYEGIVLNQEIVDIKTPSHRPPKKPNPCGY